MFLRAMGACGRDASASPPVSVSSTTFPTMQRPPACSRSGYLQPVPEEGCTGIPGRGLSGLKPPSYHSTPCDITCTTEAMQGISLSDISVTDAPNNNTADMWSPELRKQRRRATRTTTILLP